MHGKSYFSYVRVSTQRQGERGTSLAEQQAAIEHYARRFNLNITRQYEERETAAKTGRPVFLTMLKAIRRGAAGGLVIHKIDRSARNLKDWADLGSLIDAGIEVHFANESLDLKSRGGRLSADIQAVVAADYIRNLREETKKGIYGRLRQGLYPFPARVGYTDAGKGNPKIPDPLQAPLVRQAFEFYGSGDCGLDALVEKMYMEGLRNKNGGKISRNGLVCILKNPFYTGLIKIDAGGGGELFAGIHEPIISKRLFDDVQAVFAGKRRLRKATNQFYLFRRAVNCRACTQTLIAETQKGNVYYRCHIKNCPQKTVREETIEDKLLETFGKLQFSSEEYEYLKKQAEKMRASEPAQIEAIKRKMLLELSSVGTRLAKLADAYVDEVFDKETYLDKKNELVVKQQEIRDKLDRAAAGNLNALKEFEKFIELVNSVCLSYKRGNREQKREMVQIATSNFSVEGKSVLIKLKKPFETVFEREVFPAGSPHRATSRTFEDLFRKLLSVFKNEVIAKSGEVGLPLYP